MLMTRELPIDLNNLTPGAREELVKLGLLGADGRVQAGPLGQVEGVGRERGRRAKGTELTIDVDPVGMM